MVQGFRCLDATQSEIGATLYGSEHDIYVANALAWFALETLAFEMDDE
jgi:hypothetical protein